MKKEWKGMIGEKKYYNAKNFTIMTLSQYNERPYF